LLHGDPFKQEELLDTPLNAGVCGLPIVSMAVDGILCSAEFFSKFERALLELLDVS